MITLSWSKLNFKAELLKKFHPSSLAHVQIGLSEDPLEALVIGDKFKGLTQKIVSPLLQGMDYS